MKLVGGILGGSFALISDAVNSLGDSLTSVVVIFALVFAQRPAELCSFAVLIGLGIVRWAGPDYIWADEVAAMVVVCLILWSGTKLFRRSASELMDLQASDEFVQQIQTAAEAVNGARNVETLWVRKSGLEYFADIHIQADARLTVDEGHRMGHRVKDCLLEQFPTLRYVLVHLEPYPHTHNNITGTAAAWMISVVFIEAT